MNYATVTYTRERVETLIKEAVLRAGGKNLCIDRFAPWDITPDQGRDIAWALNEMLLEGLIEEAPPGMTPDGKRITYYHETDALFGRENLSAAQY